MPTTTPNLGLHKYNPSTDGNLTFDIEKAINEPFDAIDEKLGGQLIAQDANIVTLVQGQQIVTVDRKSALVHPVLRGRTLVNLLGRDGNCEDISKWIVSQSTLALDTSNKVYGLSGIKITIATGTGGNMYQDYLGRMTSGKYYIVLAEVKNGNAATGVKLRVTLQGDAGNKMTPYYTSATAFGVQYILINPADYDTAANAYVAVDVAGTVGQYAYADGIRMYELTAAEYAAIATMTADQIAAKYPYVDSVQAVKDVYMVGYGENILPPLTEHAVSNNQANSVINILDPCTYQVIKSAAGFTTISFVVPVVPLTTYTFNCKVNVQGIGGTIGAGGYYNLLEYDADELNMINRTAAPFATANGDNVLQCTFTTSATANHIKLIVGADNGATGTFTFTNPMLSIGSTAKPFKSREDSYLYLYGTPFHANLDGSVADQLIWQNGEPRKLASFKEAVIDGSYTWTLSNSYTGFKVLRTPTSGFAAINYTARCVKFDGKSITPVVTLAAADQGAMYNGSYNIAVGATDSGWGDSVVPSAGEMSAYFHGWKMAHFDGTTPYTDAGVAAHGAKVWIPMLGYNGSNGAPTLPTTFSESSLTAGWTPYKIVYQLAQAVEEAVPHEGGITLHDGANQIEVGCGVVVRETASPIAVPVNSYNINNYNQSAALKFRLAKFLAIYRGGHADKSWGINAFGSTNAIYGNYLATIAASNFDQSAAYTVTYLALDTYKLALPPLSITGAVAPNLKEAVDVLTDDMGAVKRQVSALSNTSAQKAQPGWITPTLLNGWVNFGGDDAHAEYMKDEEGFVTIHGHVKSGTTTQFAVLFTLPAGYRPKAIERFTTFGNNGSGNVFASIIVAPDGRVMFDVGGNTILGLNGIRFRAEQ